jgi:hypothetical protein
LTVFVLAACGGNGVRELADARIRIDVPNFQPAGAGIGEKIRAQVITERCGAWDASIKVTVDGVPGDFFGHDVCSRPILGPPVPLPEIYLPIDHSALGALPAAGAPTPEPRHTMVRISDGDAVVEIEVIGLYDAHGMVAEEGGLSSIHAGEAVRAAWYPSTDVFTNDQQEILFSKAQLTALLTYREAGLAPVPVPTAAISPGVVELKIPSSAPAGPAELGTSTFTHLGIARCEGVAACDAWTWTDQNFNVTVE